VCTPDALKGIRLNIGVKLSPVSIISGDRHDEGHSAILVTNSKMIEIH
jgi:hypothetical protein